MGRLYESQIPKLQYGKSPSKVYDGNGLFIHLTRTKSGTSRFFKYDYVVDGKRKQISFGKYPDIQLTEARQMHREARSLVAKHIDPVEARRERRLNNVVNQRTVDVLATEFFESRNDWKPSHRAKQVLRWKLHVTPYLGSQPVRDISRKQVKSRLVTIQSDSIDTAHRVQSLIDQVMVYAELSGDIDQNPVTGLSKVLKRHGKTNYPAITNDDKKLGRLLNSIDNIQAGVSSAALQIVALTFVRHSGIRLAEWSEIDWQNARWTIPAHRMKVSANGDLVVPLADQTVKAFETLHSMTGQHQYVLTTGIPKRGVVGPVSDGTLNKALRSCIPRSEHVVHSFRQTAYTALMEQGFDIHAIKLQMHHAKGGVQGSYDKSDLVKRRTKMMQWYADHLDQCRELARGE